MKDKTLFYHIPSFFLEWGMFETNVIEKIKTRILNSVTYFGNGAVCKIILKNVVEPGRPKMTIRRMCLSRYSEYVTILDRSNGCTNAPQCYVTRHLFCYLCNAYSICYFLTWHGACSNATEFHSGG
jgi:hypothetical protein